MALIRAIVRVYTPETAGMDLEWILMLIKVYILKAVAVRVLYSGDIEVVLPNQQVKDQAIT